MPWPSKDPEDYMAPARWDDDPPGWLARLRGKPHPDPVPLPLMIAVLVVGLAIGAAIELFRNPHDDLWLPVFWCGLIACWGLDFVWWLTRKRRRRARGETANDTA